MRKYVFILLLFTISLNTVAQKVDWYANFYSIMDNREYDREIGTPQSIMAARLDVAGGLKQDDESGLYLGINYMYEYGGTLDSITPALNLYYEIDREDLAFYAGSFARNKVIELPLFMFSDSLRYYRPNMSGMAFDFRRKWGNQNVFVDWTGRQSPHTRESFIAGTSGTIKKQHLYIENYGYMYHYALTSSGEADEHIKDNAVAALFVGLDYSDSWILNTLKFDVGAIGNMYRHRPDEAQLYGGLMGRANIHYGRFGVDVTSYWGEQLNVLLGDELYKNGSYSRIDLCAVPFKGKHIESVFKWSIHATKGIVSSSQQFFLIARF